MITPPFCISAIPLFTREVPVSMSLPPVRVTFRLRQQALQP
jgi:hypothetical protein